MTRRIVVANKDAPLPARLRHVDQTFNSPTSRLIINGRRTAEQFNQHGALALTVGARVGILLFRDQYFLGVIRRMLSLMYSG